MNIQQVAKKLNVSVATVSRTLNPATKYLVTEKTRKRIERFVKESGYVPHRAARELSSGKTRTIGLVLPNSLESIFFNDYLIKVLAGVYSVLEKEGQYNCKIIMLPRGEVLSHIDQHVLTVGIDGLLLSPYSDPLLYGLRFPKKMLAAWSKPVVLLNLNPAQHQHLNGVYSDHFEAARKATLHLVQKGHKEIAFLRGGGFFPEIAVRYEGYMKVMTDHGVKPRPSMIMQTELTMAGGYDATLSLMQTNSKKPTAIFCSNDEMALGALRALKTLNIRCPRDMAVMGYDGIDIGEFVEPRLTTVAQPLHEIAERSTRLLLDLIENKVSTPVFIDVPSQLLLRDSV